MTGAQLDDVLTPSFKLQNILLETTRRKRLETITSRDK